MTGDPTMKAITNNVNIQLDSLLVRLKLCSIDGRTGPIMPVSSDPINTPIKNSIKIKLRVLVSKVTDAIIFTLNCCFNNHTFSFEIYNDCEYRQKNKKYLRSMKVLRPS